MGSKGIGKEHHEKALNLHFPGGMTGADIADELGVSPQAVNRFLALTETKERIATRRAAYDDAIGRKGAGSVMPALQLHVDVVGGEDDFERATIAERQRSADSLLDRYGRRRGQAHEHSGPAGEAIPISFNLQAHSDDDLATAKARLLAARSGVPLRLLQLSIPELSKAIATGKHDEHLEALRKAEEAGRNRRGRTRVGALQVLDARIAAASS